MSVTRTTAVQPAVSLAALKRHLEYGDDSRDHDTRLLELADSVTELLEQYTGVALLNQTWVQTYRCFPLYTPNLELRAAMLPLVSVTSITYVDIEGNPQTLDPAKYRTSTAGGTVEPAYNESWPSTRWLSDAVTFTYVAGHGSALTDVPRQFQQALLVLAGHYDAHRGDEPAAGMSDAVRRLVASLSSGIAQDYART